MKRTLGVQNLVALYLREYCPGQGLKLAGMAATTKAEAVGETMQELYNGFLFSCVPCSAATKTIPFDNSDFCDREDEGSRIMSDILRLSPKPSSALLSINISLRRTGIARRTCSRTTWFPSVSLSAKLRRHHAHRQP